MRPKKLLLILPVLCLLVAAGFLYAQRSTAATGEFTCTISISCDTAVANLAAIDPAKQPLIPEDGIILSAVEIVFNAGDTVFDILQQQTRAANMHMEFVSTPAYNAAYIEGINNLYEFDAGPLSGWMYKVNGVFPGYGCSRYELAEGDVVEWIYTCDLGADIGGADAAQAQKEGGI